jgi:hypothetical protein
VERRQCRPHKGARVFGWLPGSQQRRAHVEALVELRELAGEKAIARYGDVARELRPDYAMPIWGLPQRLLKDVER